MAKNEIEIIKRDDLIPFVPPSDVEAVYRMAVHASQDAEIGTCDPKSIHKAIIDAVSLGLSPLRDNGEAYFYARGTKATLHIGYRGFIQLAARNGWIIRAELVYDTDEFSVSDTDGRVKYVHKFNPFENKRGSLTGGYAIAYPQSDPSLLMIETGTVAEFAKAEKVSRGGVWQKWPDEMKKKFLIRRIYKKIPHSLNMREVEARAAFDDNGAEYLESPQTQPDAITHTQTVEVVDISIPAEPAPKRAGKQVKAVEPEPLSEPVIPELSDDEKREQAKRAYIGSFKVEKLNADAIENLKALGVEICEGILHLADRKNLDKIYRYLKNRE